MLDANGAPVKDALVELWHADHAGNYIYDEDFKLNPDADPHFQRFGQFLTSASGQYLFRTVKPGLCLLVQGEVVAGPEEGRPRYKMSVPMYKGYTYEVYSNPTFSDNAWQARPFALSQTGAIDRNRHTATAEGTLVLYVEEKAAKTFYRVTFRVPGANPGTP